MDIYQYLVGKGWKVRNAPGEWQTQCVFCGDTNKYGHLYVNREHGSFFCQRCSEKGSFRQLQERLGDEPEPFTRDNAMKWEVWAELVRVCEEELYTRPDMVTYLTKTRALKRDTIEKYRLGYAPNDLIEKLQAKFSVAELRTAGLFSEENYPLIYDRIVIPYQNRGNFVTIRAKKVGGDVRQVKDTSIQLFGVDNIRGKSEVIMCEGEFDAIYLEQFGYDTCALPGANTYQEHWNHYFDTARRVFVVMDSDDAGRQGAHRVKGQLGRKAKLVELPVPDGEKTTDVSEFFIRDQNDKKDFQVLLDDVRGQRLHLVEQALAERDEIMAMSGLKTGISALDARVEPGFLPGQLITVLAKSGTGKSAFVLQLVHNLSSYASASENGPGVPTLLLSLELTKAEVAERLERIANFWHPGVSPEDVHRWHSRLRICDENRIPPKDIPLLIEEFIDEVGVPPRVMVVDYLGYWARSFPGKRYEQVSEAVMELKHIAKQNNVILFTPHQVSRVAGRGERFDADAARDSGVVEETSDFMFGLYRPIDRLTVQSPNSPTTTDFKARAEVRLTLNKSRHGNQGSEVALYFAPYSTALIEAKSFRMKRLEQEWIMQDLESSYADVRALLKTGALPSMMS